MWALDANPSLPLRDCGCPHTRARDSIAERAGVIGPIGRPADVYFLLEPLVAHRAYEVAHVTLLDPWAYWRETRQVARGDRSSVEVPLAATLRTAHAAGCRYVILTHNHPSGWAHPSEADGELTRALDRACFDANLFLLDHVILGRGQFFSFREGTLWTTNNRS